MDREVLCESLVLWLETFHLEGRNGTPEELSDGIFMAKVLNQIAPDYFNESWMTKIKCEDVTNWRLKVSNLKKILKGILEYNLEILGIQIHDFQMPDVNAIGESADHGELGRLLQLILGCAVNCTEKQEYIKRIMEMEESVQHAVMTAIQELMTKEIATDVDSEVGEQLKRTMEELNSAIEAKEELMQRCHELDLQVAALLEEKQTMNVENDRLCERLNQAENLDDPSTPAGKRFQQLQHQLEQCQEENYKLESGKDDFRIKVDVLQKEANDLKERNAELASLADESRTLKDELDVLRHTAEQVVKYEAQIESYKKKMDELSDLRGQVKLLEDKNTKYMQENLEIQEEVRKSSSIKQQLEVYKRQTLEQQSKLTEETKRADKSEFEAKRIHEKIATLQREKERIMTERDSLREMNEELKCTEQLQHLGSPSEDLATSPGFEMLSLPPAVKEKMLRLEHENKMLKLKSSGDSDEQSQIIQTMLDDANARKNELETDLRLSNQKIMELEAQIEDLQEMAKSTVSNTEIVVLRKKIDEQVLFTQQKDKIIQKERDNVVELQTQLSSRNDELEKLRDEIEKKEEEKRVMSDKYKKYFDKARAVITSQEQKLKNSGNFYPDVQALKQQLVEKDRYIEQLLKDQEKSKTTFEQEEKMMVSAWYNLGIQLNRQAAIDRLENTQGQAFLSRQRQVHLRGQQQQRIPNNTHANPSSDLDTSDSANQCRASGDGCFTTLFDCLLARLREELGEYGQVATERVPSSAIQSQLLAGLLGTSPDKSYDRKSDSADDTSQSTIFHQNININNCPEKSSNLHQSDNNTLKPLTNKSLAEENNIYLNKTPEKNVSAKQRIKSDGQLAFPFLVPETPDFEQLSYNKINNDDLSTPLLHTAYGDRNDVFSDDNYIDDDKDTCVTHLDFSPEAECDSEGNAGNLGGTYQGHENKENVNQSIGSHGNNSYAVEKETTDIQVETDDNLNQTLNASFYRLMDAYDTILGSQAEGEDDKVIIKDCNDDKIATAGRSALRSLTDYTNTPVKNIQKLPEHEQSPFIKKIPTDKVTKRRSRRKRKWDAGYKDVDNETNPSSDVEDDLTSLVLSSVSGLQ